MKKISFLSLLLLLLSSCQVDELLSPEKETISEKDGKMTTYYVGIGNGADTRTTLDADNGILWSEGDRMNIFFGVNNDNKDKLVLVEGAGTKNGSFYGPYVATSDLSQLHQTVIVYPFDENTTCVANEDKTEYTVGLTIPAVQEYTEGTFAVGSYPMIGVTEGVKEVVIETKNVISSLRFSLLGTNTIAKIVLYSDELALAGPANVVASYGNVPVATVLEATASNTVELECGEGVQLNETTPTDFYLTFAPCTGILKAKIYDTEGGYMDISLTEDVKEFERNMIYRKSLTYAADHKIVDDIKKAFKNGGEYKLPISVNVKAYFTIENGKTLHFDLDGHTLTIDRESGPGGAGASMQNNNASLHISNGSIICNNTSYIFGTVNFDENAVLELTDVNVTSTRQNGGTMMTITNATNIILNNVNVDSRHMDIFRYRDSGSVEGDYPGEPGIVINGGSYKVKAGQKIFTQVAENKLPVVFQGDCLFSENSYTGVTWAESGNEEFPWKPVGHKVFVGSQGFYSLAEAVASVEESATVTVAADLELTETVTIPAGKTVALDLAGNTISQSKECTGSYEMIKNNGTLTITGEGTLRFEDLSDGGSSDWGTYIITNNGTLVVENGTLEHLGTSDLSNHDTCIPIQNYAGKVTVNDGVISSPEFRSLRDFTAGGEIEINGGVFKGQVWMQGLGNGSSSLTIKGGEFAPTAGYDGSSIYITNGTNDVKVSIEGGKFNTKIGCADATKAGVAGCITGGLFTESAKDNTNAGLLKSGLAFVESGDVDFPYTLDYLVTVNGTGYPSIQAALAGTTGDVEISVKEGEYVLPAGLNQTPESRTVTIKGAGKDVTNLKGSVGGNNNPGNYANGLDLNFEDITFTTANSGYSGGFGHAASVEFTNCKIIGQFYAHSGAPHKFTDCTIDPLNGYLYTYASDCDFVNCDFTASQGKALQVYEDSSTGENIVNITDCRFVAAKHASTWDGKPVTGIDIHSNGSTKFVVDINNCTTSGFPTGLNSGSDLWNVKNVNGNITVFVNGANVYPGYEKVSDNEYNVYSAKGLSYFSEKTQNDVTLNIMKDIDFNDAEFKAIIVGRSKSLTIKGNNHVIKNARVVSGDGDNTTGQASFFYTFPGATLTVSDLKFDNIEVDADINGTGYAGAVVGYAEGNVILTNVDVTGADVYGEKSCGALVGFITAGGSASLTNCDVLKSYVEAKEDRTGAYAGRAQGALTVVNCTVDSEFTSVAPDGWANLYIGQRYTSCPTCTIDGKEYVDAYYGLAAAITNAAEGAELIVADGTYEGLFNLTGKKNVTIEAINTEKAVINGMVWADNCTVTLKGLKLSNPNGVQHPNPQNSQYYASINSQYPVVGAYNNAKIKFDGCVFDLVGPTVYGFYGYAHNDPVFEGCTFNCNKIRPIANNGDSITVNGCTFNDQYHYSVRIFENASERQTVVYTNNTVQGTNDKGEFEGVNISKKGSTATVYADFTVTGNTSDLKYRHHKNVTMDDSCTYVGITGFEKED